MHGLAATSAVAAAASAIVVGSPAAASERKMQTLAPSVLSSANCSSDSTQRFDTTCCLSGRRLAAPSLQRTASHLSFPAQSTLLSLLLSLELYLPRSYNPLELPSTHSRDRVLHIDFRAHVTSTVCIHHRIACTKPTDARLPRRQRVSAQTRPWRSVGAAAEA